MSEEKKENSKTRESSLKTYIFIATTAAGLALYVHQTFATNLRVDSLESKQIRNSKVNCLIAVRVGVEKKELREMCDLNL